MNTTQIPEWLHTLPTGPAGEEHRPEWEQLDPREILTGALARTKYVTEYCCGRKTGGVAKQYATNLNMVNPAGYTKWDNEKVWSFWSPHIERHYRNQLKATHPKGATL